MTKDPSAKKERLARLKHRLPLIVVIVALVAFVGLYVGNYFFFGALWVFSGILWTVLISGMAIVAGFTVLKSLFFVAAELPLLIFLAQSYCAAPDRSLASDSALRSLVIMGLLYIGVSFFRALHEAVREHYKNIGIEEWSHKNRATAALYLLFVLFFIWEIYLVMKPIIFSLCVYK